MAGVPLAFSAELSTHTPGIVGWVTALGELLGKGTLVKFESVGVVYGDKDFFVNDAFVDSPDIPPRLIGRHGSG